MTTYDAMKLTGGSIVVFKNEDGRPLRWLVDGKVHQTKTGFCIRLRNNVAFWELNERNRQYFECELAPGRKEADDDE